MSSQVSGQGSGGSSSRASSGSNEEKYSTGRGCLMLVLGILGCVVVSVVAIALLMKHQGM
ncbi:MAG: hypothetical protein R3B57_12730 [Phycisphaerales bacterium]